MEKFKETKTLEGTRSNPHLSKLENDPTKNGIIKVLKIIKKTIYWIFIIGLLTVGLNVDRINVKGESMYPYLSSGDSGIVLSRKFLGKYVDIERFDIVTLKHNDELWIKRVIALPGETIEYKNDVLYIDGKAMSIEFETMGKTEDFGPYEMKDGQYFVMGDNRAVSFDSRMIGGVFEKDIVSVGYMPLSGYTS